jgi:ribosomal protein L21E
MAGIEQQDQDGAVQRWCILRTAGPRTLPLCRALVSLGYDAWAPQLTIRRRRPRSKQTIEIDAPILPTFVFLRSNLLGDLYRLMALPTSPLPAFRLFTYAGRVPVIGEGQIQSLRQEETQEQAKRSAMLERERLISERSERHRERAALRASARTYEAGDRVTVTQPAFAGMTGVVERGAGKAAVVNLGGSITVTIEAWLLAPIGVNGEHIRMGAAA